MKFTPVAGLVYTRKNGGKSKVMSNKQVRIAIVGIGGCASSVVQGYFYYNQYKGKGTAPGVMNWDLGGYTPCDIIPVAAFDVDRRKVGRDITEAIFEGPNCAYQYDAEIKPLGVPVMMGPVLDGVADYMQEYFQPSDERSVDVGKVLMETGADVLCNFLPAGSHDATRYYADQAIKVAKIGFVNGMPEYIAKDPEYRKAAEENKAPIIGDDVKSQLGGTIIHRALVDLLNARGITVKRTYQLNYAGNTDFKNMAFGPRGQLKHESKAAGISAFLPEESSCSVGAAIVENMDDRKSTVFHFEGYNYGGAPLSFNSYLEVEDSPNFAGTIAEAARYAKIARDRGIGGVLEAASAFLMKNPVRQINDKEAVEMLKEFVAGSGR